MMSNDGMIMLNKPEGITSFRALGILKKKLNTKKVGHTGTLDKFASGLLIILTGKMTKFAPYITGMDKTYLATFRFGTSTTTLDPEGDFTGEKDIPTIENIKDVIEKEFQGKITQTPPDFSAVHVGGKRAYQLKLEGKEVKIPPREITINYFKVLNWDGRDLQVEISCSKGTYIRSIARDLGLKCNSLAYVTDLKRTVVGPFKIDGSVNGEDFDQSNLVSPYDLIKGLEKNISYVTEEGAKMISMGRPIKKSYFAKESPTFKNGEIALFDEDKKMVAMIENREGISKYLFVVPR